MRVRSALLLDNVARGNPYARLPTHSSNIMAATVKASRYGNKAKIGKSAAKLVVKATRMFTEHNGRLVYGSTWCARLPE